MSLAFFCSCRLSATISSAPASDSEKTMSVDVVGQVSAHDPHPAVESVLAVASSSTAATSSLPVAQVVIVTTLGAEKLPLAQPLTSSHSQVGCSPALSPPYAPWNSVRDLRLMQELEKAFNPSSCLKKLELGFKSFAEQFQVR